MKIALWLFSMIISGVIGGLVVNYSGVKLVNHLYARDLNIVDASGNIRIYAGETDRGPKLFLYSSAGKPLIHIGLDKAQAMVSLTSESTSSSVSLIAEDGHARLGVDNNDGKSFVAVNLGQHSPGITVYDSKRKFKWTSPLE